MWNDKEPPHPPPFPAHMFRCWESSGHRSTRPSLGLAARTEGSRCGASAGLGRSRAPRMLRTVRRSCSSSTVATPAGWETSGTPPPPPHPRFPAFPAPRPVVFCRIDLRCCSELRTAVAAVGRTCSRSGTPVMDEVAVEQQEQEQGVELIFHGFTAVLAPLLFPRVVDECPTRRLRQTNTKYN